MSLDVDRLLLYYFYHSFVNSMQISVDCASSLFGFEELWLFRPFAGSPLADSPPPLNIHVIHYWGLCLCFNLLKGNKWVTDRRRRTTVLIARPLLKYGRLKTRITSPLSPVGGMSASRITEPTPITLSVFEFTALYTSTSSFLWNEFLPVYLGLGLITAWRTRRSIESIRHHCKHSKERKRTKTL